MKFPFRILSLVFLLVVFSGIVRGSTCNVSLNADTTIICRNDSTEINIQASSECLGYINVIWYKDSISLGSSFFNQTTIKVFQKGNYHAELLFSNGDTIKSTVLHIDVIPEVGIGGEEYFDWVPEVVFFGEKLDLELFDTDWGLDYSLRDLNGNLLNYEYGGDVEGFWRFEGVEFTDTTSFSFWSTYPGSFGGFDLQFVSPGQTIPQLSPLGCTFKGDTTITINPIEFIPPSYPTGIDNAKALFFDGDAYVEIGDPADGTFDAGSFDLFTWEAWIKSTTQNSNYQDIISKHQSGSQPLLCKQNDKIVFYYGGNYLTSNSSINLNEWYHVALVRTWNSIKIYINGVEDASTSFSYSADLANDVSLRIGAQGDEQNGGLANYWNGYIDEVRIWDADLSSSQIQEWMSKSINPSHPRFQYLEAYYKFDDGLGTTLKDIFEENDGELRNFSATPWVVSAAAVGDSAVSSYGTNASVELQPYNWLKFKAKAETGFSSTEGLQAYWFAEKPSATTLPNGVDSALWQFGVFGIKKVAGSTDTYEVTIDYSSVVTQFPDLEGNLVILKRDNNEDVTWEVVGTIINQDPVKNTIRILGQTGTQYVLGFSNSTPYPQRPGSGYALDFDGVNDYINLSNTSNFSFGTGDFSVGAWAKFSNAALNYVIVGAYDGSNGFWLGVAQGEAAFSTDVGIFSTELYNDNKWHHFQGVRASGVMYLYVDGNLVASGAGTGNVTSASDYSIGRFGGITGFHFPGQIDEVRIWNAGLTQTEVRDWMTQKINNTHPKFSNLAAYYRFDESTGSTLVDLTGNADGTLTNMDPNTDWVVSGAALGDTSVYTYADANISLVEASLTNVSEIKGLQLYKVNQPPNETTYPINASNFDTTQYFGVFDPSNTATYTLNLDASSVSNTDTVALALRTGNDDNTWVKGSTILHGKGGNVVKPESGSLEFTSATLYNKYPQRPGSGYALDFDGANDYVDASTNAWFPDDNVDDYTYEAWINLDDVTTQGGVISYAWNTNTAEPHSGLWYSGGQLLAFVRNDNAASNFVNMAGGTLTIGEWTHVALVKSGNTYSLYQNGELVNSTSATILGTFNRNILTIGSLWNSTTYQGPLNGKIDEARIWRTGLSQSEIRDWMFRKVTVNHPKIGQLAHYYNFDEGSGTTVHDLTGSNDAATHANFGPTPTWTTSGAAIGDSSVNTYTGGNIVLDEVTLKNTSSGNPTHLFKVTESPNSTTAPSSITTINGEYYGVFDPKSTSNLKALVDGSSTTIKSDLRVMKRDGNADIDWEIGASLINNPIDGLVDLPILGNIVELIIGKSNSTYPMPNGAGYALDFDGVDDHVALGGISEMNGAQKFTFETWMKVYTQKQQHIFSKSSTTTGSRIILSTSNPGRVGYDDFDIIIENGANTYALTSSDQIQNGEWVHVALVYDGTQTGNTNRL